MSTLQVTNIQDTSGSNSRTTAQLYSGSAKAWVSFDGTTSPGTIKGSFNVSSVTKNGSGDYTVNWSSSLSSSGCFLATGTAANASGVNYSTGINPLSAPTTLAVRILQESSGGANVDDVYLMVAAFG